MMVGRWIIMRNMKLFIIFAVLLFLAIGYKTYEQYHRIKDIQKLIVLNESQSLAKFISAFRQTHQDAFLSNHIDVNEKTINLLPVKTITEISNRFSSSVQSDIVIRTVSDRPRNMDNMANDFELEMIQYFKHNPKEKQKFLQKDDAFYYTQPLRIKESCLQCHGKREDTIPSIRDKYANAYDYKLGDIRGLWHALYFSVVTMTTLGFGDIAANPDSWDGQALLMFQVILGYVLLGALVTRFAVLFTAGGPAGRFPRESTKKNAKSEKGKGGKDKT